MKEMVCRLIAAVSDVRLIVAVAGTLLSVVMHELFHIIVHWGDIRSVHIFPDKDAIAAVLVVPSGAYDLVFEEAMAYLITMVTLLLTAKLVSDIHDARDRRSAREIIFGKISADYIAEYGAEDDMAYVAHLLGVEPARS